MAKCKWCGAEITGTEALCGKCKENRSEITKVYKRCECGTVEPPEGKVVGVMFEPYTCKRCLWKKRKGKILFIKGIIIFMLPLAYYIGKFLSMPNGTEGSCCICRNKAEYQFQGDDYCKKHFNMAVNDTLNN